MNTAINPNGQQVSHDLQRHNNKIFGDTQPGRKNNPEAEIFHKNDKVSIQYSSETSVTYTSSLTMNSVQKDGYGLLRELVTNMLKEQGVDFQVATGTGEVDISEISQDEAKELISEDGYFGVEQTSTRIVDFATAIAGGDPSRIDAIREGIEKGFNDAKEAFGGTLPDISYETYDAVMEKLDAFAESGNAEQVV